jgi:hypothetical protein
LTSARGPREEDHPVRVPWDFLEPADHLRTAAASGAAQWDRCPQPSVELATKFLNQALFVLGDVDIALGNQHLAMPRLHPQEAHLRDYVKDTSEHDRG